jgi:hypothetical protein
VRLILVRPRRRFQHPQKHRVTLGVVFFLSHWSERLWSKRDEQIRGIIESTVGMYGDLQGIAGKTLQEIDGLELPMLNAPASSD